MMRLLVAFKAKAFQAENVKNGTYDQEIENDIINFLSGYADTTEITHYVVKGFVNFLFFKKKKKILQKKDFYTFRKSNFHKKKIILQIVCTKIQKIIFQIICTKIQKNYFANR